MIHRKIFQIFILFLSLLLAFSDVMGISPFTIAGFKFYGADFLIILFLTLVIAKGPLSITNSQIALLLLLFTFFGVVSMLQGFASGYEMREIVGDFRRLFFYSLAFGITWRILDQPERLQRIHRIPYVAVIPVIIFSVLRAWRGISWTPRFTEEDIRAVSYISATVLFWVFYDGVSRLAIIKNKNFLNQLHTYFWLILVSFTFVIANYRLFWFIPILGSISFFFILLQTGILRDSRVMLTSVMIISLILTAVLFLKFSQNELYVLIERKFVDDVLGFQFKDSFRYFVWGEAWDRLKGNALFGVGIGDVLEYSIINSQGNWYLRSSTTHNIFLEILYQTGIVGLILFFLPHSYFVYYVWNNLSKIPVEWSRPALTLLLTYLSMFLLGNFQPFLTVPSVAVLLYTLMGITARFIYWGRHSNHSTKLTYENSIV